MTRLCVSIIVHALEQAWSDARLAAEHGADLVEYRVDLFTDLAGVEQLVRDSPLPCIVTCRPTWEGGACDLPDQERIPVLEVASLAGAAYIDVELAAYTRSANLRQKVHLGAGRVLDLTAPRPNRQGLIVSSHDFAGRPARLHAIVSELNTTGADVVKIAWTARSVRDNLEAFELLRTRQKPTIALCMGEAGLISRVLAPKFGGFLTFAALRPAETTAPGQPTLRELTDLYRFRSIGPATAVYGVVGHPVSHSLSPHVHNPAFASCGLDAVYLPMPVQPGYPSFKAFMETFGRDDSLNLRGLSITLPHKENAFRYLRDIDAELDDVARRACAVNTISFAGDRLRGSSTDHAAILHCVRLGLSRAAPRTSTRSLPTYEQLDLTGLDIAVIGAGGTGRTAVAALDGTGARVHLYNRTVERAVDLARQHPDTVVAALPLTELRNSPCTVFIQTTSLGLAAAASPAASAALPSSARSPNAKPPHPPGADHAETGGSVWDEAGGLPTRLGPGCIAFDCVYTPLQTRFLQQAREAGATVVEGVEMFAHQAQAQFRFWTGTAPPLEHFRKAAIETLAYRGLA